MFGGRVRVHPIGVVLTCCVVGVVIYARIGFVCRPSSSVNLKLLLVESVIAAQKGGLQVTNVYDNSRLNVQSKGKTKEGANNPVTDADLRSHYAIVQSLHTALGSQAVKIISEEHTYDEELPIVLSMKTNDGVNSMEHLPDANVKLDDVVIWVDPLDATQEFTEGLLDYVTVMVCVAVKGSPLLGVIHKPFKHQTAWAWVGQDVSSNLKTPPQTQSHGEAKKVIVSRSHPGTVRDVVSKLFGSQTEILPAGGAGYKVLQVISGEMDAYVHVTAIKKWDICAGDALLRAVGGRMTTLHGNSLTYGIDSSELNEDGLVATRTTVNHVSKS